MLRATAQMGKMEKYAGNRNQEIRSVIVRMKE